MYPDFLTVVCQWLSHSSVGLDFTLVAPIAHREQKLSFRVMIDGCISFIQDFFKIQPDTS